VINSSHELHGDHLHNIVHSTMHNTLPPLDRASSTYIHATAAMARSVSAVVLLLLLVAASGANAATKTAKAAGIKLILDLAAQPKRAP
jgi:hypothetical protein